MTFEASVPSTPRQGSYYAVYGLSDQEGGGDVRIEAAECTSCYAVVEKSRLDAHIIALHPEDASGTPKGAR